MELQLEILNKAVRAGYRVAEIPAVLEWNDKKTDEIPAPRTSKMRIFRTIRNYLLFGLLSRPAILFVPIALYLVTHGSIMTFGLFLRLISLIASNYTSGLLAAMSAGLKNLVAEQGYSVLTASILLVIGIQLFAVSMQFIQNQIYFEELSKLHKIVSNKTPNLKR